MSKESFGRGEGRPRRPSLRGRAAALLLVAGLAGACDQSTERNSFPAVDQSPNQVPAPPVRVNEPRPGFVLNSRHMKVARYSTSVFQQLEPVVINSHLTLTAGRQVEANCFLEAEDPSPDIGERLWYRIANSGALDNVLAPVDQFETRLPSGQLTDWRLDPNVPPCPDDY